MKTSNKEVMAEIKKDFENEELHFMHCPAVNFSRIRIIKNIVVLCVVFFLTYTAYDCLSMLQSTLNHDKGIGVVCLSITYAVMCLSSLLFSKYIIQKLGCKRTLVLSMCLHVPYVASNLYPHWSVMVPAGFLCGLSASLIWGSQCIYLNEMSVLYAMYSLKGEDKNSNPNLNLDVRKETLKGTPLSKDCVSNETCDDISICSKVEKGKKLTVASSCFNSSCPSNFQNEEDDDSISNKTFNSIKGNEKISDSTHQNNRILGVSKIKKNKVIESTIARMFGIFEMAFLSTNIWSNLMSYFILQNDPLRSNGKFNASCICGAQFCNDNSECFVQNLLQPSEYTRYVLTGVCISLAIIAILILAIFLDPLNDMKEQVNFSLELLLATYELSKKRTQLLLIPMTFYLGMMQGFYNGDFTMSYVGCAWGTYHVSLVGVCYGACCAISSPLSGWLMQRTGRPFIFIVTSLATIVAQILLLAFKPTAESPTMFFFIAGLWGASFGVFSSQLKAMYGFVFKDEEKAAFPAYFLWYSLGSCLSFAYSNYLCTYLKIYTLILVLILGMIGYLFVEFLTKRKMTK